MSELIYIDTNVYLDYFMNRTKGILSPEEITYNILKRTLDCEFQIVISDILIVELERYVRKDELATIIKWLRPKIKTTKLSRKEIETAKTINIHFPDCLHIYIARKLNATLVSNDNEMQEFGAIPSHTL